MKWVNLSIFSKDRIEMHMEHNLSISTPKGRNASNLREKENLDIACNNLFQVNEDDCNIIVN